MDLWILSRQNAENPVSVSAMLEDVCRKTWIVSITAQILYKVPGEGTGDSMNYHRKTGQRAEELAAHYLKCQKIEILEKNYRCRWGEIDLIGWDEQTLVFIEVKAREDDRCGYPGEAVTYQKRRRICRTAGNYCCQRQISADTAIRFDVIEILGDRIRHIENAFEYQV